VQVSEGLDASVEVKAVTPVATTPAKSSSGFEVVATLPGSVFKVTSTVGQNVKKGDILLVLEAMKMEIEIVSPQDGVVSAILVNQGDNVEDGQPLVVL
jgi:pyruvate carboxylase subunit B